MTDYEFLDSVKICHRCRKQKQALGRKFCFDCLEKFREENDKRCDKEREKEYQKRRREIYRQKKEAGVCVRCSKPATHGLYCYECSIKAKKRNIYKAEKRKRARHERGLVPDERRDKGLCLWCGEKAVPGLQCCEKHQKIFKDAGKKAYQANLKNKNNPWINEVEIWKKKNNWKRLENT